ncbi:Free methionine-R-sulfoxide reductase [Tolypothrix tenuis PCC 7101]|uniref:Free methionine-R-sulfoxide reductase n=1 Tax=Tolypothrix tenuis PCC 7101 TaxID=231146 RepID=A0A1Z4N9Z2_9CYAN|nr:GAF domain-containing protein [Aulosira sp. FACHB-113]BAZ02549.1 Free methionine-R-sulfoxide reductase [Tolypothrix tenuis PCC 7101]BAZ73530.1 Free methionine-R-sulfoxide reductase [Aulosira laxa NIES-50]
MAELLQLPEAKDRETIYIALLPQIKNLIAAEKDLIANLANITAVLHQAFNFFWVGFYRRIDDELVLGPFQGTLACTRIHLFQGVCGASASQKQTIIVPDVDLFPGHIACSSASRSEIVVPLEDAGEVQLVLDIDSDKINDFSTSDAFYLEQLIELIKQRHFDSCKHNYQE